MASTNFIDRETIIQASWLNDVNAMVYGGGGGSGIATPGTTVTGFVPTWGNNTGSALGTGLAAPTTGTIVTSVAPLPGAVTGTPTSSNYLRGDGTWAAPSGSGDMILAATQTVTGTKVFSSGALSIANPAGTFNSIFTNTNTFSWNYVLPNKGGVVALTNDLPITMTSSTGGLVPTPPNNTTTFLRGDGVFAAPSGGGSGDMILAAAQTVTGTKTFLSGALNLRNAANTFSNIFTSNSTFSRNYIFPDAGGTIALTTDFRPLITVSTIYVGSTGNDTTGTGTLINPFLTMQKCWDYLAKDVDCGGRDMIVQFLDTTYVGSVGLNAFLPNTTANSVTFTGKVGGTTITTTSGAGCFIARNAGVHFVISTVTLVGSSVGQGSVFATNGGFIELGASVVFSTSSSSHIRTDFHGKVQCLVAYSVTGNATYHMSTVNNGTVRCVGALVTVSGGLTMTAWAFAQTCASIDVSGASWSTLVMTGLKYNVVLNSVIYTNGGVLPGNSAGTTATGGQYF